ncbi:PREDICTED: uncharacterized protein LOC109340495, partial [Lupinus angustifolius]|uniref:uncharacterized protein LOC109340495 n=1 Tax=Lupinus angustifolius TaxID=3871 RepID=UPI00092F6A0F
RLSHSQCWVKIQGLPQEYWSPKIIFSIAGGIGTPISLDDATTNRTFGHFAKVLVDINLKAQLPNQILVEREGFAFFVNIEYENLPEFCNGCQTIGHMISNCRRVKKKVHAEGPIKVKQQTQPSKETELEPDLEKIDDLVIDLEFDNRGQDLDNIERVMLSPGMDLPTDAVEEVEDSRVEDTFPEVPTHSLVQPGMENIVVQAGVEIENNAVIKDMKIVGRLWDEEDTDLLEEGSFTSVISKSQKKKMKKRTNAEKVHYTRRGGYLNDAQ